MTVKEAMDKTAKNLDTDFKDEPRIEARIRFTVGKTYFQLGALPEAEQHLKRSIVLHTQVNDSNDMDCLASISTLAGVYYTLGNFELSEKYNRQAMEGYRTHLSKYPTYLYGHLNNLAEMLATENRFAEAEPLFSEALSGYRALNITGDKINSCLNNYGKLKMKLGHYDEAERLYFEAAEGFLSTKGENHPPYYTVLGNLAALEAGRKQYEKALGYYTRCVDGMRRVLPPNHPNTLLNLANLCGLLQMMGKSIEALPYGIEAADGYEKTVGLKNSNAIRLRTLCAVVATNCNDYATAERMLKPLVEISRDPANNLRKNAPNMMEILGSIYANTQKYDLSIAIFREGYEISREVLGPADPQTWRLSQSLSKLQMAPNIKNYAIVKRFRNGAYSELRAAAMPGSPITLQAAQDMADFYAKYNEPAEAIAVLREATDDARKALGPNRPETAPALAVLARHQFQQKQYKDVEPALRECLTVRQAKQPGVWTTFNTMSMLGESLCRQGKLAEAEPLLTKGWEGLLARSKTIEQFTRTERLREAAERMIDFASASNRPEDVKKWQAEARKYPERAPVPRSSKTP